jgi:quercetin dioxygenase-like cupin family protein
MTIRILDPQREGVPMPMIAKQSRLVVSPHMGARYAVMNIVELMPGEKNTPHTHPTSEDSLFLVDGSGWAHDLDAGKRLPLEAGCAVVVPPGIRHTVEAGREGMKSIGGPVPADLTMLRAMGVKL